MPLRRWLATAWQLCYEPWYAALSLALIAGMAAQIYNRRWIGDFWEHAAVVREFATHPLAPLHPELLVDAPHAFFSPYALALGWFSRLTSLDAISVLGLAGMANLLILLFAVRVAARYLLSAAPRSRLSFYMVLFLLALWSATPWPFSGFYHLGVFLYVMPYPSTLAFALAILAWVVSARYLADGSRSTWLIVLGIMWFTLLTHLPTAGVTAAGICSLLLARGVPSRRVIAMLAIFPLAFAVAALWYYYPFIGLLQQGNVFDASNQGMYLGLEAHIGLAVAGIAALLWRARRNMRDWLVWTSVILAGIYLLGFLRESWSLGRVLGAMAALAQWACASWVADCGEGWLPEREGLKRGVIAVAAVVLLGHGLLSWGALKGLLPLSRDPYAMQTLLAQQVGQYDVVLTDVSTGVQIPAFSGKVIATDQPLAFVPDLDTRAAAVESFFARTTETQARRAILDRYHVKWVLVNHGQVADPAALLRALQPLANVAYDDGRITLLGVRSDTVAK